ncbi:MAG: translation initiation factor eIF-1A [Candidatus Poseidonia sp.]|nr:translation initiation factor eIF-1A [Poseidonia sp.]MBL6748296.1 translation initiation factor eIF-1A [Poseidonia sp.]MBL6807000.1 translation initiation factor eIF-1A [Poseidonia sp.]MBL6886533.1 translation initiation factor eIF-1A [Poseidonia sp.]MBL6892691.1 translation initiation factor eIF-1A [Poseidonia sp.]
MPNKKVNEMFALAQQILGGRRVTVLCADGETRMARIPGKMRRRQWVREGDLIIVWPWDFQDSKADVKHRYTKTQAMYLSRKGVLPDDVDMFGMGVSFDDDGEHDDLFSSGDLPQEAPEADEAAEGDLFADDESDDLFADDADDESDDLFADDADDESDDLFADDADEEVVQVEEEPAVVEPVVEEDVDDDDDDDVDALFA